MGFWTNVRSALGFGDIVPNENGPLDYDPGDPDGFEIVPSETLESRSLSTISVSPWSGWPADWATPDWKTNVGINKLVDIAWACLDLNSNIVSSMPVYQLKDGQIIKPEQWMFNPDPAIYTCWQEFAKQLFWDYQMGEAFVLKMTTGADGKPYTFRVVPPWLINVEMVRGSRAYTFGGRDVTDDILHIRYYSTTINPRGMGPLDVAGARMTSIRLLQRYADTLAETGGVPLYWLEIQRKISQGEGRDLLNRWVESRQEFAGHPALVAGGAKLNQAKTMDAKEMGLLEIQQFSESRIAILLGVPPFLVGLAGAAGSLTYSNIADLFDFHDRSSLRPKSRFIMESLSGWALPRGRSCELNRDDYTRLPLDKRAAIYKTLGPVETGGIGVLTADEIRIMERFYGSATSIAAQALTGGTD